MLTKEYVLENVKYKLVNGKTEHGFVDFPTKDLLDLKAEYRIENEKGDYTESILVTNQFMEYYDLSLEELDNRAKENTLNGEFLLKTLEGTLMELNSDVDIEGKTGAFVLTNKKKFNGSTVLLYNGFLKYVSNRLNSNLLILPSSIHEVIVLKLETGEDINFFRNLVAEINAIEVAPEEVLSNNVYIYNRNLDKLIIAWKEKEND